MNAKNIPRRPVIKPAFPIDFHKLRRALFFPAIKRLLTEASDNSASLLKDLLSRFIKVSADSRHPIVFKKPRLARAEIQVWLRQSQLDLPTRLLPVPLVDERTDPL